MSQNIDQNNVNYLVAQLQEAKKEGLSITAGIQRLQAPKAAAFNQFNAVRTASASSAPQFQINSADLGCAMAIIDPSFTPLQIAVITKELFDNPADVVMAVLGAFPDYTAIEMGKLLLDNSLYPTMSSADMHSSLQAGGYSDADINSTITALYALPDKIISVDFSNPAIQAQNATVETGQGTMFNDYYKGSWIMHYPGMSYIKINFNHQKTGNATVNLVLVHLTSMLNGSNGFAPIDILVNNTVYKSQYDVVNGNYQQDTFDITNLIAEGDNTIQLNFCNGARSNYWIRDFKVDYVKSNS